MSGLLVSLVLIGEVVAQGASVPDDPKVRDAIALFSSFCVATAAKPDRALAVIGSGNAIANRLPDDVVEKAQAGQKGGTGWALSSPGGARLMLDYTADGTCSVRLAEADEAAMVNDFGLFMSGMAKAATSQGKRLIENKPEVLPDPEMAITYRSYGVPFGDRMGMIALTTMPRAGRIQQHMISLKFAE